MPAPAKCRLSYLLGLLVKAGARRLVGIDSLAAIVAIGGLPALHELSGAAIGAGEFVTADEQHRLLRSRRQGKILLVVALREIGRRPGVDLHWIGAQRVEHVGDEIAVVG